MSDEEMMMDVSDLLGDSESNDEGGGGDDDSAAAANDIDVRGAKDADAMDLAMSKSHAAAAAVPDDSVDVSEEKKKVPAAPKKKRKPQKQAEEKKQGNRNAGDVAAAPEPKKKRAPSQTKLKWGPCISSKPVKNRKGESVDVNGYKSMTLTIKSAAGDRAMKLDVDDFVRVVWKSNADDKPRDGGIYRIERMVNDEVGKSPTIRLRKHVALKEVPDVPEYVEVSTAAGEDNICATEEVFLLKQAFFSCLKRLDVAVGKSASPGRCALRLLPDHFVHVETGKKSGKSEYAYVDSSRIPDGTSRESYLATHYFTRTAPGGLLRDEVDWVTGKSRLLKPPEDCSDAKSKKAKKQQQQPSSKRSEVVEDADSKKEEGDESDEEPREPASRRHHHRREKSDDNDDKKRPAAAAVATDVEGPGPAKRAKVSGENLATDNMAVLREYVAEVDAGELPTAEQALRILQTVWHIAMTVRQ